MCVDMAAIFFLKSLVNKTLELDNRLPIKNNKNSKNSNLY